MKEDLTKKYEDILDMTASPGWGEVLKDIDVQIAARMNPYILSSERDLYTVRGQLEILNWFRDLKVGAEAALANQKILEDTDNDFV